MLPTREALIAAGFPYGKADDYIPLGNPSVEWMRTRPDRVIYIPHRSDGTDADNCSLRVIRLKKSGEYIALWTQSSVEGWGDNRMALSRSKDGVFWSPPCLIMGAGNKHDRQASFAMPLETKSGRVYIFFVKETKHYDNNRQESGVLCGMYSDDGLNTFSPAVEISLPRSRYDNSDTTKNKNLVPQQAPVDIGNGKFMIGATLYTSHSICLPKPNWVNESAHCCFLRLENMNEDPEISDIQLSLLPENDQLLGVANTVYPEMETAEEPFLCPLPDCRIFVTMRTMTGYVFYSVSDDGGATFSVPEVLRFEDGSPVCHPLSPCPVFKASNGSYVLCTHNNTGKRMGYDELDPTPWPEGLNIANYVRNPLFISVGKYDPSSRQPIRFGKPEKLLDTGDVAVGPKRTAEIGTYSSVCEVNGKTILWYPDRKFYLLGKDITAFLK